MPDEPSAGPLENPGGCAVDWSWLAGREIAAADSDLQSFRLTFRGGETLIVRVAQFQGTPFLSFTPWRPS
jgi:hypothetical protein